MSLPLSLSLSLSMSLFLSLYLPLPMLLPLSLPLSFPLPLPLPLPLSMSLFLSVPLPPSLPQPLPSYLFPDIRPCSHSLGMRLPQNARTNMVSRGGEASAASQPSGTDRRSRRLNSTPGRAAHTHTRMIPSKYLCIHHEEMQKHISSAGLWRTYGGVPDSNYQMFYMPKISGVQRGCKGCDGPGHPDGEHPIIQLCRIEF